MAETATETITIAASPEQVWAIATDLEKYPEWTHDVKDVVITSRDHEGRPSQVEFRTSALGRSTHYTLSYDYSDAPAVLAWTMIKGDIQRSIDGAFKFHATADGGTYVEYDLAIELVVPLPGFVKRRAERRILNAIKELKAFAEADPATPSPAMQTTPATSTTPPATPTSPPPATPATPPATSTTPPATPPTPPTTPPATPTTPGSPSI